MRFLLDTHTFLWFVTNDMKLGEKARQLISEPTNQIFISPATYWEVAIKVSIGKYPLTVPFEDFFRAFHYCLYLYPQLLNQPQMSFAVTVRSTIPIALINPGMVRSDIALSPSLALENIFSIGLKSGL